MSESNTPQPDPSFGASEVLSENMVKQLIDSAGRKYLEDAEAEQRNLMKMMGGLPRKVGVGTVLYYPACGMDWDIIKDFSTLCQVFVYCDWHFTSDEVRQSMEDVPIPDPAPYAPHFDWNGGFDITARRLVPRPSLVRPGFLKPSERHRYQINYRLFANQRPWCRCVPVHHWVGGKDHDLSIIYVCTEGVNTYRKLFHLHNAAPKYLCIKRCGDGFGFNYTPFFRWKEPLGRAVLEGWKSMVTRRSF